MTQPRRQSKTRPLTRLALREGGFAFAILAVWLLSLLSPMHLVSRAVTELRLAGVETGSDWTLCIPSGQSDDEGRSIPLCPGKSLCGGGLLPPVTGLTALSFHSAPAKLGALTAQLPLHRVLQGEPQPRAPPWVAQG
ncbi:hypothetical protein [Pseudogemmobacter faecipullorum]|uniref:DUF2946 domain-containing protein n=1 Tax=Pseudogemmobacter faecipullorum TaxID=2755041 RepID=A0ABS8CT21_9RHOB|nr:hypothetical protein [Pseudogemmobacter faecipullorum]MCB5412305.1 hypothetical protein [Pseudogemmobacter faecipullorum]